MEGEMLWLKSTAAIIWLAVHYWGLSRLRTKTGSKTWLLNPFIYMELAGLAKSCFSFFFVPGANLIFMIAVMYALAKRFNCNSLLAGLLSTTIFFTCIVLGFGRFSPAVEDSST